MKWIERELRKLQEKKKRKETEETKRKEERKRKELQESESREPWRGVQPTKRMRVKVLIPIPERLGVAARTKGPSTQARYDHSGLGQLQRYWLEMTTTTVPSESDNYNNNNNDNEPGGNPGIILNPESACERDVSDPVTECLRAPAYYKTKGQKGMVLLGRPLVTVTGGGVQKGKARIRSRMAAVEPSDVEEEEVEEGQKESEEEEERELLEVAQGYTTRDKGDEGPNWPESLAGAPEAATTSTREETTLLASAVENVGRRLRKIEESSMAVQRPPEPGDRPTTVPAAMLPRVQPRPGPGSVMISDQRYSQTRSEGASLRPSSTLKRKGAEGTCKRNRFGA
ncbi:hypothetical protein K435DRAFT_935922 [Dendrothele bispora CBS 962.96]|uniref:Uncharacterized protein n=1 Tax=Dendrothele bispora (strain CBS 962.96) TaxID=1314807 RepID=A0A4V4HC38_DENBC|nr:hypothetical protein K435DRAFT_935922 [Dendrothele bispora CBS 962.96]